MNFSVKKPLSPCLISAGVDLLVFVALGEELLCPAELSLQYLINLKCFEMNRHCVSSQMAKLPVVRDMILA